MRRREAKVWKIPHDKSILTGEGKESDERHLMQFANSDFLAQN